MAAIDYYNTDNDTEGAVGGATWRAQTFTASQNYSIGSVKLLIYKTSTPGIVTVSIRATTAGEPSGADLCSGTVDGDALGGVPAWTEFTFASPASLTSGVVYAIILRSSANYIQWQRDSTAPSYAGGIGYISVDNDASWIDTPTIDYMFETYAVVTTTLGLAGIVTAESSVSGAIGITVITLLSLAGTVAATSAVSGAASATTIVPLGLSGTIVAQSSVTGALSLITVLGLSGSIEGISSVLGHIGRRVLAAMFPPARADTYNEDAVYDEDTGTWGSDEELLKAGGSRYRAQLVVVAKDLIYYEVST